MSEVAIKVEVTSLDCIISVDVSKLCSIVLRHGICQWKICWDKIKTKLCYDSLCLIFSYRKEGNVLFNDALNTFYLL